MQLLDTYFDALVNQDWDRFAKTLSDDVHRTGPFLDIVEGKTAYLEFLSDVMPTLKEYELRILKVRALDDGSAVVWLNESLLVDNRKIDYPEVLFFEFDSEGLICKVDIYLKQPP